MRFLHKDEFENSYSESHSYPIILQETGEAENELQCFMDSDEINSVADSAALIQRISDKIHNCS